ncbi:MAG: hypothetical protein IKN55_09080 [Oscillospiraceae bacterium]|nr:hypothetical protein [Oscillospiraceae bacterium]
MTNREKLANMAMYDMLLTMAKNFDGCILEIVTGKDEDCRKQDGQARADCKYCVSVWLNEEYDE